MAHKRSASSLHDPASQPTNKLARTETIPTATDALLSANARIFELEYQIQDLHAFINANGLTRSRYLYALPPKKRLTRDSGTSVDPPAHAYWT